MPRADVTDLFQIRYARDPRIKKKNQVEIPKKSKREVRKAHKMSLVCMTRSQTKKP